MSKKSNRRKAHSAKARDQRLFSHCRLWTWEGLAIPGDGKQYTTAEMWSPFGWTDMGHDKARQLLNQPRNWSVGVRALCRGTDGSMWMESRTFDLPSYNLQKIQDAYHRLRADTLAAQRTDQVFDMGWICQTWHGAKPEDAVELWHYQYAPEAIIRKVTDDERIIRRMKGPGYSQERFDRWQQVNIDYLEQRKLSLAEGKAA